MLGETRIPIISDADVVPARQAVRALAGEMGFPQTDITLVATAISEIARNIIVYANHGEIVLMPKLEGERRGIEIVAEDEGPGISDIALAMKDGYTTGSGLGMGLPGAKRLVDEFEIDSKIGEGTRITMRKWLR